MRADVITIAMLTVMSTVTYIKLLKTSKNNCLTTCRITRAYSDFVGRIDRDAWPVLRLGAHTAARRQTPAAPPPEAETALVASSAQVIQESQDHGDTRGCCWR